MKNKFIREFLRGLKDNKVTTTFETNEGLHCDLTGDSNILSIELPSNVQSVINSRIDKLRPTHLMVLKVASVIGNEFSPSMLLEVYPVEAQSNNLSSHLSHLANEGFLSLKERDGIYQFKHRIIQECAYNRLLFQQRLDLHKKIALKYEEMFQHDISSYFPKLAYHWIKVLEGLAGSSLDKQVNNDEIDKKFIHKAFYFMQKAAETTATNEETAYGKFLIFF